MVVGQVREAGRTGGEEARATTAASRLMHQPRSANQTRAMPPSLACALASMGCRGGGRRPRPRGQKPFALLLSFFFVLDSYGLASSQPPAASWTRALGLKHGVPPVAVLCSQAHLTAARRTPTRACEGERKQQSKKRWRVNARGPSMRGRSVAGEGDDEGFGASSLFGKAARQPVRRHASFSFPLCPRTLPHALQQTARPPALRQAGAALASRPTQGAS